MPTIDQMIVWVAVGLIGGGLAAAVIARKRDGFGVLYNLALGLAGSIVGGFIFRLFGLFPNLDKVSISLRDVVAAVVGSLIVLLGIWVWNMVSARRAMP